MQAAKVQASLPIRAVAPEPPLLAHTSSESRGTFRQKARSLAPLNGWTCTVKICHDGMLEDTNSLDGAFLFQTAGRLSDTSTQRKTSTRRNVGTELSMKYLGMPVQVSSKLLSVKLKQNCAEHSKTYKSCASRADLDQLVHLLLV